jgi:hypothetical protein
MKPFFVLLFLALFTAQTIRAEVTGNPDVFDAGVWVQHPGIAVGRLFANDSSMITVVGDGNGYLHAWYANGNEIPGFPKEINDHSQARDSGGVTRSYNYFINSTPNLIDINGDGDMEIFVGSGDGWLYGLDNQGNALNGWPKFTGAPPATAYTAYSVPRQWPILMGMEILK